MEVLASFPFPAVEETASPEGVAGEASQEETLGERCKAVGEGTGGMAGEGWEEQGGGAEEEREATARAE